MQNKYLKHLYGNFGNMYPVILGCAGVLLVSLPAIMPADRDADSATFILGMSYILAAAGLGITDAVVACKNHKAPTDTKDAAARLNTKQSELNRQLQNKINTRQR